MNKKANFDQTSRICRRTIAFLGSRKPDKTQLKNHRFRDTDDIPEIKIG